MFLVCGYRRARPPSRKAMETQTRFPRPRSRERGGRAHPAERQWRQCYYSRRRRPTLARRARPPSRKAMETAMGATASTVASALAGAPTQPKGNGDHTLRQRPPHPHHGGRAHPAERQWRRFRARDTHRHVSRRARPPSRKAMETPRPTTGFEPEPGGRARPPSRKAMETDVPLEHHPSGSTRRARPPSRKAMETVVPIVPSRAIVVGGRAHPAERQWRPSIAEVTIRDPGLAGAPTQPKGNGDRWRGTSPRLRGRWRARPPSRKAMETRLLNDQFHFRGTGGRAHPAERQWRHRQEETCDTQGNGRARPPSRKAMETTPHPAVPEILPGGRAHPAERQWRLSRAAPRPYHKLRGGRAHPAERQWRPYHKLRILHKLRIWRARPPSRKAMETSPTGHTGQRPRPRRARPPSRKAMETTPVRQMVSHVHDGGRAHPAERQWRPSAAQR